ncbi:MAG: DDE-type integrase/transposase/recombinase [Deltaproteobacteria bacterium]|nr:DDE-type integrase/transposase/recombinase [Deltaproteobacteria bacterium]
MALGIVHRLHPEWTALTLKQAAEAEGVSPQRLSRLVSRAVEPSEATVAALSRRGRPRKDTTADERQAELALHSVLLETATSILGRIPLRRRIVGALVVGAWLRVQGTAGLTQKRFCQALALPPRTLRAWLSDPPRRQQPQDEPVVAPPPTPRGSRKRPPRHPRFGFDIVLPDTQLAADTTGLSAFGLSLKLVAAQDVGGRDQDLLDSVVVDDHESAEIVARVLTESLADMPGAQVIVDQGTPYMAQATVDALDALDAEHAPQREGNPQAKATIERAFETVKVVARPLLDLTDRIAAALPSLQDPALAIATTRLVVTSVLRAYQYGARAARRAIDARGSLDPEKLARLAAEHREQARATERSARLLLAHLHDIYDLPGSRKTFVDSLRRYPLEVLHRAEHAFRAQVHRDDIRDRRSYFAAIVRRVHEVHRSETERRQRQRDQHRRLNEQTAREQAREQARRDEPVTALAHALVAIAAMWRPEQGRLLFGGTGIGTGLLDTALGHILALLGPAVARDTAHGVFAEFSLACIDRLGTTGIAAVRDILLAKLDELAPTSELAACRPLDASAILGNNGPKQRPPPSAALRK